MGTNGLGWILTIITPLFIAAIKAKSGKGTWWARLRSQWVADLRTTLYVYILIALTVFMWEFFWVQPRAIRMESEFAVVPPITVNHFKPEIREKASPRQYQKKDKPIVKPDVIAVIGCPEDICLYMVNNSDVPAIKPTTGALIWDLDTISQNPQPLLMPEFTGNFIRARDRLMPMSLIDNPSVKGQIKKGHRVFGVMSVTCPDCLMVRWYWVYAVQGTGGWYSPLPPNVGVDPNALFQSIKAIAENTDQVLLNMIPISKRIPIASMSH